MGGNPLKLLSDWDRLWRRRTLIKQLSQVATQHESINELLDLAIEQRNQVTAERDNLRLEYEVVRDSLKRGYCPDIFGHSMYTNPRDAGMSLGSLNGRDIADFQGEIGFFVRNIRPGHRVLDLGANVGLFTLLFARCVGPRGIVYAFEPGPLSAVLLTANVMLNRYENVIIERAAVTDRSGDISLYVCSSGESDNRIDGMVDDHSHGSRVTVRGIALDDYFVAGECVDVVKMDIQGAEMVALRGMERLVSRSPNIQIVMEYMPASPAFYHTSPREFLTYIRSLGLNLYDLPEYGSEVPVTEDELLESIGPDHERHMTNLVLRRY